MVVDPGDYISILENSADNVVAWNDLLGALSNPDDYRYLSARLHVIAASSVLSWQSAICAARALIAIGEAETGLRYLRRSPDRAQNRREAVSATYEASWYDDEFQMHVVDGDAHRDRGDWQSAEWHYWEAISFYPLHGGYTTQYAHVLKEQSKYLDAEIYYRTARALGEDPELDIHISFVAAKTGLSEAHKKIVLKGSVSENLSAFATHYDIDIITRVLLGRILPAHDLLPIQRVITTVGDTIALVISSAEFAHKRRNFLEVLLAQKETV